MMNCRQKFRIINELLSAKINIYPHTLCYRYVIFRLIPICFVPHYHTLQPHISIDKMFILPLSAKSHSCNIYRGKSLQ